MEKLKKIWDFKDKLFAVSEDFKYFVDTDPGEGMK